MVQCLVADSQLQLKLSPLGHLQRPYCLVHLSVAHQQPPPMVMCTREVCCFPGARVRDIARKLTPLVQFYYPLLVFQISNEEISSRSPRGLKKDFKALG